MYLHPSYSLPYLFVLNFGKIPSSAFRLSNLEHQEIIRWIEKYGDRFRKICTCWFFLFLFSSFFFYIHVFPNFSVKRWVPSPALRGKIKCEIEISIMKWWIVLKNTWTSLQFKVHCKMAKDLSTKFCWLFGIVMHSLTCKSSVVNVASGGH